MSSLNTKENVACGKETKYVWKFKKKKFLGT